MPYTFAPSFPENSRFLIFLLGALCACGVANAGEATVADATAAAGDGVVEVPAHPLPRTFEHPETLSPGSWHKSPVGGSFPGRTVALAIAEQVYFFYEDRLSVLDLGPQSWQHLAIAFPFRVDPGFAAAFEAGAVYVLAAEEPHFFRLDPETYTVAALAPMPQKPGRGARLVGDSVGNLYAIVAGGHPREGGSKKFFRYEAATDHWQGLPDIESVNNPGRYSSALHHVAGSIFTYGDHHIARYDPAAEAWQILFYVMRYRPFLDRGGMSALDPETGFIYVTLGGESNSLGVLLTEEVTFRYLRPRLPFSLGDSGETLFLSRAQSGKRLHLLSNREQAIYSIDLGSLRQIGIGGAGKAADNGSPWDVQNVSRHGAHGGLFRHVDSYCSGVFVPPHFYYQRKNVLRRVNPLTSRVSPLDGMYKFHPRFSTSGAAITTDGDNNLYLFTGHDRQFFVTEIDPREAEEDLRSETVLGSTNFGDSADSRVRRLSELPEVPSTNTAATYFDDAVIAILRPDSRSVHRYLPSRDEWATQGRLPDAVTYDAEAGMSLVAGGEHLWLLAGDKLFSYTPQGDSEAESVVFSEVMSLSFAFASDGGMAAWDRRKNSLYVSLGGGSRDLGVVDLESRKSFRAAVEFPDVVSVAGQRMFVLDNRLYIYRGHDSAELWRIDCDQIFTREQQPRDPGPLTN